MSACIQILNNWGESFLNFAWPMLWQSSLLIALVFAFDVLLARRLRAAVRYALWLAVLVKLLLPPALALPTGAAWWLWPAKPPLVPAIKSEVVTFDTPVTPPPVSLPQTIPFVSPHPELTGPGWAVLGCAAISAALLLWVIFRWLRVAAKVRRADASGDFVPVLEETRPSARLRRCPRLKLIDDIHSPAVYGLFRPVILLPRALAEKLSARQLRAVLLHEAIHLRRGDVWVNCAQTLLQIIYWWHPLLWLANARIRRVREETVDDAVMLALRRDADAYAPTLLEVAKFSRRRPLAGLALVGILESRSALRWRIERLVDFRPPRKAGLTFLSLCGIFAFSAVALPMGQGPAPENAPSLRITTTPIPSPELPINAAVNTPASNSVQATIEFGLNQALVAERKEAHLDLEAGAVPPQTPIQPRQLHIKARFIEVPKNFLTEANLFPAGFTNGVVLSNPDFQLLLHELEHQKGVEELAEPEVTTLAGRQTQMRATIIQPFLPDTESDALSPNHLSDTIDTNLDVETGPVIDIVPTALPDGYTLSLRVLASELKSFHFGNSTERQVFSHPFPVNGISAQKTLYDGRTLVLFPVPDQVSLSVTNEILRKSVADYLRKDGQKDKNKVLLVFVTATLIDAAGNRIHSDDERPIAPYLTAEQATAMARQLANDKAFHFYESRPFRDGQPARLQAGHWSWEEYAGYGFHATVQLAANGSTNSTDVQFLDTSNMPLP